MKELIKKYEEKLENLTFKRDQSLDLGNMPQAWFLNGKIEMLKDVISELKGNKPTITLDCGVWCDYDVVIKGKYKEHGKTVELPQNYKLIIIEVPNV